MPIPLFTPPENHNATSPSFALVVVNKEQPWASAPFAPRAVAYVVDLLVVSGFSLYFAKWVSLFFLSLHMPAIRNYGRGAGSLFRDILAYGNLQIGALAFVSLSLFYFVWMPWATGRTLGLGLLGLKIQSRAGGRPTLRGLALRQMGCLLHFATGGLMYLQVLKGPARPMLQDWLSGTRVSVDADRNK